MTNEELEKAIEEAMDRSDCGLDGIRNILARICNDKAAHVFSTYQDKDLSDAWYDAGFWLEQWDTNNL
jgi:hypothetical protein